MDINNPEKIESMVEQLEDKTAFSRRQAQVYLLKKSPLTTKEIKKYIKEVEGDTIEERTIQNTFHNALNRFEEMLNVLNFELTKNEAPHIPLETIAFDMESQEVKYVLTLSLELEKEADFTPQLKYSLVKQEVKENKLSINYFNSKQKEGFKFQIAQANYPSGLDVVAAQELYTRYFEEKLKIKSKELPADTQEVSEELIENEAYAPIELFNLFEKSTKRGEIQVGKQRGSAISISCDSDIDGPICFSGNIGSGTSYNIKHFVSQFYKENPDTHILFLDPLETETEFVKNYDGEELTQVDEMSTLSLNQDSKIHSLNLNKSSKSIEQHRTNILSLLKRLQPELQEEGKKLFLAFLEGGYLLKEDSSLLEFALNSEEFIVLFESQDLSFPVQHLPVDETTWFVHRLTSTPTEEIQQKLSLTPEEVEDILRMKTPVEGTEPSEFLYRSPDTDRWVPAQLSSSPIERVTLEGVE